MPRSVTDEVFLSTWERLKSAQLVANELGINVRNIHRRRKSLEAKHSTVLRCDDVRSPTFVFREHSARVDCEMPNLSLIHI